MSTFESSSVSCRWTMIVTSDRERIRTPPRNNPPATDFAWAAGIVDGEGCFNARTEGGRTRIYLRVKMVHKPTILRLRRIAGYGSVHRETHTTRRTIWLLAISAQQAVTFVEQMIPFMLTKRGEAIAFLA